MPSRAALARVWQARHRTRLRRVLAAALLASAGLAVPARAAVTLDPLAPCYVSVSRHERQKVFIHATGFTPLAVVDVRIGRQQVAVDADPSGAVSTNPSAPFQRRGQRRFTVSLTERENPASSIAVQPLVTALAVHFRASRDTRQRVRFHGRGFTQDRPIYAHYVYGGKVWKTVRFARRPTGACGRFSAKRREIPVLLPPAGRWLLQVDQQRHWSRRPDSVLTRTSITVKLGS